VPKILIVDDEPDVIEFQASYLRRRKHEVFTAKNTTEALEAIKNISLDLVFCDIALETSFAGFSILEQAKKLKPELPIYLITGFVDKDIMERGISLGAREVLGKPVSNEDLELKIKEVFS